MRRSKHALVQPLAPGTQIVAWRVESLQGQGAYGAVYRAVPLGQEPAGPVALKLALYPWDARFGRETELLTRVRHPGIPRLLARGIVRSPSGDEHPFFVMEWVEGTPLYSWAEQHAPSAQELCRVLAQLARTLEAVHAAGAVHRDVKGDNVLVRLSDNRPVLIDFGSGHFQDATRLTWQSLPPGTRQYLSPQAGRFEIGLARHRDSYYPPTPADDLYALGVTAYRLVMGQYPPPLDAVEDETGAWHVVSPDCRHLLEANPRVGPRLRAVLLRLLSDEPEARGTMASAAEALEMAAEEQVPRLQPVTPAPAEPVAPKSLASTETKRAPRRSSTPAREREGSAWLPLVAVTLATLLLWPWQREPEPPSASTFQAPGAGPTAVGDSAPAQPKAPEKPPSKSEPISQEPPPEPRPGQLRPEAKGGCPGSTQVLINGGCWVEQSSMAAKACAENGYVLLKGKCYAPALETAKRPLPTSDPATDP